MDSSLNELQEVSGTMLITLFARAKESLSKNPILFDKKAVEIIDRLIPDFVNSPNPIHRKILRGSYNSKLAATMALRSRYFDRCVGDFIKRNPRGTVVNIGCGLDTRFERIDNGTIHWFDIDLPEVIELRRKYLTESERQVFIGCSILERGWIDEVKADRPYLFVAEGVFMYLEEKDLKALFAMISDNFPHSELVCEVTNRFWVDKMKSRYMRFKFKHQLGMSGGATFTFGVPHSRYFEEWDDRYKYLDEWTYFDEKDRKLGWYNVFSFVELLRKVQWTVRYLIE